jgi:hypothetical protein
MTKEKLTNDILTHIADRKKVARRDFKTSETLLLISVVISFTTAALAVNNNIDRSVIATLSGLPGIIVVNYIRFSYARRSTWNELYRIDLQRLLKELEVAEPLIVAEKYTALKEKKDREWATKKFEY